MVNAMLAILIWAVAGAASAEVYRWVDESGRTHYSDAVPPEHAKPTLVGADARGGFVSSMPLSYECHSLRCQGERLEQRLARREAAESADAAARAAAAPAQTRGLDFRKYVALREGMSEGELLGVAGEPDLLRRDHVVDLYTYMPTSADPFTTTIKLVRGRVAEIDRQRKF
jgi:Domain of unknown function (DUF4124)